MEGIVQLRKFSQIDIKESFFDSLRADYDGFDNWFQSKSEQTAHVMHNENGNLDAFLYVKKEVGPVSDVVPALGLGEWLKIGTMKINPHGTRLGERLIKKSLDYAIVNGINQVYVTVFPKHVALVSLFKRYGFIEQSRKQSERGDELVLTKQLDRLQNDILLNYPVIRTRHVDKYMLSIYPEFHTRLFPDSILNNESYDIIEDVSHTNSIHKVYICSMNVSALKRGDIIVMYRTKTPNTSAYYTSVATSICVVEEIRSRKEFANVAEFIKYCKDYSVFSEEELKNSYFEQKKHVFVIKMTYNVAFRKKLNRKRLIEEVGLDSSPSTYWGFFKLSEQEFEQIIIKGEGYESLIVH
ncbi:hypothetical protein GCM10008018_45480 [Paenibacillus marchantiophytorum]|uniref:N-acetyltransferase domain-containing protein n=1 Tax=Paenibacillus marchantiophytorum TaxID=1619310 RepID=A0ABQ1EZQ1_9BACL|nr:N-acetyltransferase [Paenibacillus marchantiophytorum]GFZ93915.1 hypothetical protein GCM10008018_45480 [Paenibacillus marchantiophytorum]